MVHLWCGHVKSHSLRVARLYIKTNRFADIISVGVGDVVTSKVHLHAALIKVSLPINSHELGRHVSVKFCTAHGATLTFEFGVIVFISCCKEALSNVAGRKQLNCAESSAQSKQEQGEGRKRRDRSGFYYAHFGHKVPI